MGDKRKLTHIRYKWNILFKSKYMSYIVGVFCVLCTVFIYMITRANSIIKLEQELNSFLEINVNRVESRIDNIEFNLSEFAQHGYPNTPQENTDWENRAEFYVTHQIGVRNIVLIDLDLTVKKVYPTDNLDYYVNQEISIQQNNPHYRNVVFSVSNEEIITGFIVAEIDVIELIMDISEEWPHGYAVQIYHEEQLLTSSDSWENSSSIMSVKDNVYFQNKFFELVISPTKSMVQSNTNSSNLILTFGLSLSLLITYIWYTQSLANQKLEKLVEKKTKELVFMSYHDQLTGIYNRRYYEQKITEFATSEANPFTIILADINGLKLVNDAFGHLEGDNLIKLATELMIKNVPKQGVVCRIGGDEFAMILPKVSLKNSEQIIAKIEEQAAQIEKESIQLSISFGVATREKGNKIEDLFRVAEDRMYQSKLTDVPSIRSNAIDTIMHTLYEKDNYSEKHVRNVAELSKRLGQCLQLPISEIKEIHTAGLLHDIGKIIIPSEILNKQGLLNDEEYNIMKSHPEIGFRILNSTAELRKISKAVLHHHERYDGSGYPQQLIGKEIPQKSRIISVVDAYDAMITYRAYQRTRSKDEALEELFECSGSQFDPDIVKVFIENFDEISKGID